MSTKVLFLTLAVCLGSWFLACSKDSDTRPVNNVNLDDDVSRDWSRKGMYKPAPKPGNVLK